MVFRLLSRAAVAVLLVVTVAACRGADGARMAAPPSTADLEALYWARQDAARADVAAADVRFMRMMISHHAQALVLSALAPARDASAPVRTLAARITNAQSDEIATMQRWLRARDRPVPTVVIDGTALRVDGTSVHGMDMAGILTQAQIDALAAARGPAFDRLFLAYMIEHHRGAVTMVDALFATDGAAQDAAAFRLAADIHADQTTEIARMQRMLDALPGADRRP
jgi:uncharacterized protein (DUF305 family)